MPEQGRNVLYLRKKDWSFMVLMIVNRKHLEHTEVYINWKLWQTYWLTMAYYLLVLELLPQQKIIHMNILDKHLLAGDISGVWWRQVWSSQCVPPAGTASSLLPHQTRPSLTSFTCYLVTCHIDEQDWDLTEPTPSPSPPHALKVTLRGQQYV